MRSLLVWVLIAWAQASVALEYAYIDAGLSQVDTHYRETYGLNPVGVNFSFSKPFGKQWLLRGNLNALSDQNTRFDGEPTQTVFSSLKLGIGHYWVLAQGLHLIPELAIAKVSVDFVASGELAKHIKEEQLWFDLGLRYQLGENWEVDLGLQHKQVTGHAEGFVRACVLYAWHPRFQTGIGTANSEHTDLYSAFGRILF